LEDLKQIGPYSKQILNYSYPPLLYQRGDDEEEDDDEGGGGDGLPDFRDEIDDDEDQDIQELIKGSKAGGKGNKVYNNMMQQMDNEA
jgi:hypothetical protein